MAAPILPVTNTPKAGQYKAYGFPSLADLTDSYPLAILASPVELEVMADPDTGGFPVLEDSIILMGKTLLGTTRTYDQAQALCRAWRLNKPTRRTLIDIPKPAGYKP